MKNIITGYTGLYGVVANPIKHSFSPAWNKVYRRDFILNNSEAKKKIRKLIAEMEE